MKKNVKIRFSEVGHPTATITVLESSTGKLSIKADFGTNLSLDKKHSLNQKLAYRFAMLLKEGK